MAANQVQVENVTTPPVDQQVLETQPTSRFSESWKRWFLALQSKVNVLNARLVAAGSVIFTGSAGTYGSATEVPEITVDSNGYITNITQVTPANNSPLTTKGDIYTFSTVNARLPVGTTGYVLTASASTLTGLAWAPATTPTLPVTTKGDLLGFDTAADRIPVGTDGQVLTARSTMALGVDWETSTGYTIGSWQAPTFTNSWVNYGAPYSPAGYCSDNLGIIRLRGLIKSGTGACFTLPSGYQPPYEIQLIGSSNTSNVTLTIAPTGVCTPTGAGTYFSLDGMSFRNS